MTGSAPSLTNRDTWLLTGAGLSLVAACYGLARFGFGLFVPALRTEFGLDGTTTGLVSAGSYASYCVGILVATVLTGRAGSRALAVAAGMVATAGTLTIAAAPSTVVLAAGVVLAGASTGVASPPLAHVVARRVTPERQDRVQAVVNAGTGAGVVVAGPVALIAQEQWRAAWVVFALLCAVATTWVAVAVRAGRTAEPDPTVDHLHDRPRSPRSWRPNPLLPPESLRLVAAALLLGGSSAAGWTFGRDLLGGVGRLDDRSATAVWIVLGGCGLLGALAGDLTRGLGLRRAWSAAMLGLAAATGLLAVGASHVVPAGVAAAAFGGTYIALSGLLLLWGTTVYRTEPAFGVGLAFLAIAVGQMLGAPLVGLLWEELGPRQSFGAAALVAVVGAFTRPATASPSRAGTGSAARAR